MNILDGVSYGMITFPSTVPVFADFGGIGVSMFFVSCVTSQLVYTGGGSIFRGGNGSMMIEVVPFFHSIVGIISSSAKTDSSIVATTMVAFALSSILTGIAFGLLGFLKLGSLCEFFPRHILVGCIGGVGAFLFVTGMQVSARLEEGTNFSLDLLKLYFSASVVPLWVSLQSPESSHLLMEFARYRSCPLFSLSRSASLPRTSTILSSFRATFF